MRLLPLGEEQAQRAAAIYDAVTMQDERRGFSFSGWKRGLYPTLEDALQDARSGALYGVEAAGALLGVAALEYAPQPEYGPVAWGVQAQVGQAVTVHRLAVHPEAQGQGVASFLLRAAGQMPRCRAVRLDTWEGNRPAIALYARNGFIRRGEIVRDLPGGPVCFYCFEKEAAR